MKTSRREAISMALMAAGASLLQPGRAGAAAVPGFDDATPLSINPPPAPLTAPGALARLDGVDLWYWDTGGDNPAVVLLHPATGSGLVWGYQQAAFAAAGYRVIGYSRRGFHGSTSGDPAKPGTAAEDLRGLLDHLGIERAHLVGTAAGGIVAASFALAWPQRVRSLVLACTLLSPSDPEIRSMIAPLREPWYNTLPHEVRELSPSYRAIDKDGTQRWHDLHAQSKGANPPVSQPSGEPATLAAISRLAMPVLFVAGDADLISPPPLARRFSQAVAGSRIVVLPECGHSAYWERPREFNAAVLAFLS
jgi:pimeloyl-ACP methyl ester carboxylesterase